MKISKTISITAPPSLVFKWLQDSDRFHEWVTGFVSQETIVETPNKVGSRHCITYQKNGVKVDFESELLEYDADNYTRSILTADGITVEGEYILKAPSYYRTELTGISKMRFKGIMVLFSWIMNLTMRSFSESDMEKQFTKLKELVEADYRAGAE